MIGNFATYSYDTAMTERQILEHKRAKEKRKLKRLISVSEAAREFILSKVKLDD